MPWFLNKYRHCNIQWDDEWDCECNDRCPECNKEITPFASYEVEGVDADAQMEILNFKVLPFR